MIGKFIRNLALIFLCILKRIHSNVKISAPLELIKLFDTDIIPHKYGKFGKIPFSHSLYGKVYYHFRNDSDIGCDLSKMAPFAYDGDYMNSPIIMMDHGDCRYTKKAYNAEYNGAKIALIISDREELTDRDPNNYDDGTGEKIKIPTLIIPSKYGKKIKDFMKNNPSLAQYVTLSINFKMEITKVVDVKFYLNPADSRSLQFFVEFEKLNKQLGDKVKIEPIYKYYNCTWCDPKSSLKNPFCIGDGKYCGITNQAFKIKNGTLMLEENIRQKCIFVTNDLKDIYWKYMIKFSKTCADFMEPKYDSICAEEVMGNVGIDMVKIKNCMDDVLTNKNLTIVKKDSDDFNNNKVFQIPELRINKQKFRGGWYDRNILDAICEGMLDPIEICKNSPVDSSSFGWGGILLIILLIIILNIILIYCYKRIVNKSLESSIEDKIQTQTIFSLGQYKVFQDEGPQKKVLVKNEDY